MKVDGHGRGVKRDRAPRCAELPHGEEGSRVERGYDVDSARSNGQTRKVKFGIVGTVHDGPVRVGYADRSRGGSFVNDCCGDRAKMGRAAGVGNSAQVGWYNFGGPMEREDRLTKTDLLETLVGMLGSGVRPIGSPRCQLAPGEAARPQYRAEDGVLGQAVR